MIATTSSKIPLPGDATVEVHAATERWPVCLLVNDGERSCSVDLSVTSWAALKAAIEEAMGR